MKSNWHKPQPLEPGDPIPEMEVIDFQKLMKDHFKILSDRVKDAPKYVRFVGPPYDPTDRSCKSADGQTCGFNFTSIKGPVISRVLRKFDITEDAFVEAYNAPPNSGLSLVQVI